MEQTQEARQNYLYLLQSYYDGTGSGSGKEVTQRARRRHRERMDLSIGGLIIVEERLTINDIFAAL
jgi:hypothetical protein